MRTSCRWDGTSCNELRNSHGEIRDRPTYLRYASGSADDWCMSFVPDTWSSWCTRNRRQITATVDIVKFDFWGSTLTLASWFWKLPCRVTVGARHFLLIYSREISQKIRFRRELFKNVRSSELACDSVSHNYYFITSLLEITILTNYCTAFGIWSNTIDEPNYDGLNCLKLPVSAIVVTAFLFYY